MAEMADTKTNHIKRDKKELTSNTTNICQCVYCACILSVKILFNYNIIILIIISSSRKITTTNLTQ